MSLPLPAPADLLAQVVHDLKNSLSTVRGNAEYLGQAPELTPDSREALDELVEGATGAERLVADIATLSCAFGGRLVPRRQETHLRRLLEAAAGTARARAARLAVSLRIDDTGDETGLIDPALAAQLVRVLISLALRRAPSGSEVLLSAHVEAGRTLLRVVDAGPALPPDRLAALFAADASIALLAARAICEAHGGSVRPEELERGMRVTVDLG